MVKNGYPLSKSASVFLFSALAWALVTVPLQGRVGERQGQIEDRMLADGTAQRMQNSDITALNEALRAATDPAAGSGTGRRGRNGGGGPRFGGGGGGNGGGFDVTTIDTLLWQSMGQTLPEADSNGVRKRPPQFPEYIYFKTDDGTSAAKKLQSTGPITGWELRVYLYKQLSGLEIYHRVGATLSDAEVAAILSANRGNGSWNRGSTQASTVSSSGDDSGSASFIGFEYERADGQVRARRVGNDLILFSTELDKNLIKVRDAVAQAIVDPKNAVGGANLANSTHGF